MTSRIERAQWAEREKEFDRQEKLIAGYNQSGNAGYGNPEKINWGPGGGRKNPPGPGAIPPIKKV